MNNKSWKLIIYLNAQLQIDHWMNSNVERSSYTITYNNEYWNMMVISWTINVWITTENEDSLRKIRGKCMQIFTYKIYWMNGLNILFYILYYSRWIEWAKE